LPCEARHLPELGEKVLDLALEVAEMTPAPGHGPEVPSAARWQASAGSWDWPQVRWPRCSGSGTARCSWRPGSGVGRPLSELAGTPEQGVGEAPRGLVHELSFEAGRASARLEDPFRALDLRRRGREHAVDGL